MASPQPSAAPSIAYFNGAFRPFDEVRVSPLDRGYLFGDGVYEVIPVVAGRPFLLERHLERLCRSLHEIGIVLDQSQAFLRSMLRELIRLNGGGDLALYLQVTRGAAATREHAFPADTAASVLAMASPMTGPAATALTTGVAAITTADTRWARCDIKAITLLPNVLARQQATAAGAAEAILLRGEQVVEGAATNVFVVVDDGICTPGTDQNILAGITRGLVIELCHDLGLSVQETVITRAMLKQATEVWLSSSTKDILPVTRIDAEPVGPGQPGPYWQQVYDALQAAKQAT